MAGRAGGAQRQRSGLRRPSGAAPPSGRATAGGFRFAILAQRKRPAVHGRPPAGLIRPKPFAFARSAAAGRRPLAPPRPNDEVREGRARWTQPLSQRRVGPDGMHAYGSHRATAPQLPRQSLGHRVQSRGRSASSATCGTERCGRNRPAGGRHEPAVFAKANGRLENPRPQRGRAGAQPSNNAAQRPLLPSAGVTGATRLIAPGSCDHARAPLSSRCRRRAEKKDRRSGLPSFAAAGGSALASLEARVALADYERFAATTDDLAVTVPQLGGLQG